jgi:hypothetical protein
MPRMHLVIEFGFSSAPPSLNMYELQHAPAIATPPGSVNPEEAEHTITLRVTTPTQTMESMVLVFSDASQYVIYPPH